MMNLRVISLENQDKGERMGGGGITKKMALNWVEWKYRTPKTDATQMGQSSSDNRDNDIDDDDVWQIDCRESFIQCIILSNQWFCWKKLATYVMYKEANAHFNIYNRKLEHNANARI